MHRVVIAEDTLLVREGLSRYFEYYLIPVGIIFVLMVIFLPQGFLGFLQARLKRAAVDVVGCDRLLDEHQRSVVGHL